MASGGQAELLDQAVLPLHPEPGPAANASTPPYRYLLRRPDTGRLAIQVVIDTTPA